MNLSWNQNTSLHLGAFLLNLLLAAVLGWLLSLMYARFGRSLSNRRAFARNFLLLTVTTTLVISIVKSSVALSLGLVGALSIVRFRAAVKEPEELVYLFVAISIGLGLGAGQAPITCLAVAFVFGLIVLQHLTRRKAEQTNLHLTVTSAAAGKVGATRVQELLTASGIGAALTRLDESPGTMEAAFRLGPAETARLEQFNQRLRELDGNVRVTYVPERHLD
jgi:uncharacterized membrane protein YhiD involved in acid resistance